MIKLPLKMLEIFLVLEQILTQLDFNLLGSLQLLKQLDALLFEFGDFGFQDTAGAEFFQA